MTVTTIKPFEARFQEDISIAYIKRSLKNYIQNELNFSIDQTDVILLILTEMLTNVSKYAGGVAIVNASPWIEHSNIIGIDLKVSDYGPGILDLNLAMRDGYTTLSGSLGLGLSAIKKLSDEFVIETRPMRQYGSNSGTIIQIKKRLNVYESDFQTIGTLRSDLQQQDYIFSSGNMIIEIDGESIPRKGQIQNGDGFYWDENERYITLLVIDGIGHGHTAFLSAQSALTILKENINESLQKIIQKIHRRLSSEVGGQLVLMRIDKSTRVANYISIGNVKGNIFRGKTYHAFNTRDGTVGINLPTKLSEDKVNLNKPSVIVIHSDGISRNWIWDAKKLDLHRYGIKNITKDILNGYSKNNDDATIVVIQVF